jgi:hypothetical protein
LALRERIERLALSLAPLVRLTTGEIHPAFPKTLLHYHLLTDTQLDDLAHFYHQRTPSYWTMHYPKPMGWRTGLTIDEKRRKFGKFIGMMGCDTPNKTEEELQEEIWEEARRARMEEEDLLWRRK